MLKRISVLTLVLVVVLSAFSLTAFANEPVETVNAAADLVQSDIALAPDSADVETSEEGDSEKEMQFKPMAFVENLNIMGVGMLGIFIVIAAIIISVFVLNKLTSPKPSNKEE